MEQRKYLINKGVNRPIEFRGLQAQYIGYLAGAVLLVLITFTILYLIGISPYGYVPFSLALGGLLIIRIYRMSQKYGQYGIMKRRARKAIPPQLRFQTRTYFTQLTHDHGNRTR